METKIQKRTLGKVPLQLSVLGLGTVKFGRNTSVKYPQNFELPSDEQINDLLMTCKNNGINFLDTAPAYGTSEERLGNHISHERHDWIICTKVGEEYKDGKSTFDFTDVHIQKTIENSLKKLKTDYIDIALIHSNGFILDSIADSIRSLQKLKEQNVIRAIGVSTKNCAETAKCLPICDVLMVTYNSRNIEEAQNIVDAKKHNTSIIVKKVFDSGHLMKHSDHGDELLQNALAFESVASAVVGTISPRHLQDNIDAAAKVMPNKFYNSTV